MTNKQTHTPTYPQTDTILKTIPPSLRYRVTRISHCEKKLARLQFDFDVVNTTDDNCNQQIPSVALYSQQLTTTAVRRRSARLTMVVV